jgi:hypothetical protein
MKSIIVGLALACVSTVAQAACTATVSRSWMKGFTIEAFAQGPSCEKAVVTLVVRGKASAVLYMQAYDTGFLMNFSQSPPATPKQLQTTAKDWISGESFMTSADKLVLDGEFPFTVNEAVDATAMKRYRKDKAPIFCFIQGMESGNCLVIDKDGTIVELGVQSFPG